MVERGPDVSRSTSSDVFAKSGKRRCNTIAVKIEKGDKGGLRRPSDAAS